MVYFHECCVLLRSSSLALNHLSYVKHWGGIHDFCLTPNSLDITVQENLHLGKRKPELGMYVQEESDHPAHFSSLTWDLPVRKKDLWILCHTRDLKIVLRWWEYAVWFFKSHKCIVAWFFMRWIISFSFPAFFAFTSLHRLTIKLLSGWNKKYGLHLENRPEIN